MKHPVRLLLVATLFVAQVASAQFRDLRAPWGTGQSRGEDLVVSLVTFGPGDDIPSWFGHAALVVEDRRLNQARLYNYGMFNFEKFAQFALGRLWFWVGEEWPPQATFRMYKALDRDVRIQELNLTPNGRLQIAKALADNVLPENRDYLYDHYKDNCATRLRDMIDRAIGGQLLQANSGPARFTLRQHTERYSAVNPPMSVLLDFLMNHDIDKPLRKYDEAFLPAELESQVQAMQYVDENGQKVPLVKNAFVYFDSDRPDVPDSPPPYGIWLLLMGLVTGAVPVLLVRPARTKRGVRILLGLWNVVVGLVLGLPGLVLLLMWLITNHTVTFHNENLLLANPITTTLIGFGFMLMWGSERAWKWLPRVFVVLWGLGLLEVVLKVLPWFDQNNWRLIALILPISFGGAFAFNVRNKG